MTFKRSRSTAFWLQQIINWGDRLADRCRDLAFADFNADLKTIDAVSWCIGCIGEACGVIMRIDPDFVAENPQLQLAVAYSARNRFVHGYFDLDAEQMWSTATVSAPQLVSEVRVVLQGENDQVLPRTPRA